MNLPRWCSTTKIIVSFLNAELNATAMVVAHLKAAGKVEAAGWIYYRGSKVYGECKSGQLFGEGNHHGMGLPWSRSEESVK